MAEPSRTPVCDHLGWDAEKLGEYAARLTCVAIQLGHASPRGSTVYIHPSDPEGQYLRDLLDGVSTDDLMERYGFTLDAVRAIFTGGTEPDQS
jgi:hypothetical protein